MSDLKELTKQIELIIEEEKKTNPDLKDISVGHANLLAQIVDNFHLTPCAEANPEAEMIYLGAPTGAGKDTLVRKIIQNNGNKPYVVLNMDMFRHYHNEISGNMESISDKDFAHITNQTSYELYYLIQEIILRLYPGTNVIVTGTMKDIDWVKEIVNRYKADKKTKYKVSLATLAVPINESAFSIFERYLNMVNTRGKSKVPLRYTTLDYHKETTRDFISTIHFFEDDKKANPGSSYFERITVYKRSNDMFDLSEDTLIYDSEKSTTETATETLRSVMYKSYQIDPKRMFRLLNIVGENEDYLKSQGLFRDVLVALEETLPEIDKSQNKKTDEDNLTK